MTKLTSDRAELWLVLVHSYKCKTFFMSLRAFLSHKHSYVTYDNLTSFLVKQRERSHLVSEELDGILPPELSHAT